MKTLLSIFFKHNNSIFTGKFLIILVILSYFSILISIPSISNFAEIGPFQTAKFDIYITGNLNNKLIKGLDRIANGNIVKGALFGQIEVMKNARLIGRANVLMVDDVAKALQLTQINTKYLAQGKAAPGAILDESTAKKLGVRLGDRIRIKIKDKVVDYKITAILFPTAPSQGLILADYHDNIKEMFNPAPYGVIWLKANKDIFNSYMREFRDEYLIKTRDTFIEEYKTQLEGTTDNWNFKFLKFGSFLAFLMIMLWDTLTIYNNRQIDYALLLGIGFKRIMLSISFIIEHFTKLLILITLASLGSKLFIEKIIGFYYPVETIISTFSSLIIIAFITTLIVSIIVFNRFKRIPIAKLLSENEV